MRIKSSPDIYFHQALGVIQEWPPYNKLSKKELQVLAELMKCKYEGWKPLLNYQVRLLISDKLEISKESLRNNLVSLRKKGLIVENDIPEKYLLKYLQTFNFEFYEETN
jgi:hypothetical protein